MDSISSIFSMFDSLQLPPYSTEGKASWSAAVLTQVGDIRIAKGAAGEPALLLPSVGSHRKRRESPIVLENLSVRPDAECRVLCADGKREEATFTILHCTTADPMLRTYFLRILGPIIQSLSQQPTANELPRVVANVIELFRALGRPPRKSVQGLWAELLLIAHARDPQALVSAWHSEPEDRYDFNAGSCRLEVKSASGSAREHYFSLGQLQPPTGTEVVIVSILVEPAGGGTSLREMLDSVRDRIASKPELVHRVDQVVGMTLGEDWRRVSEDRFDLQLALDSLRFYSSVAIPSVPSNIPPEVSDVRFRVDLTAVQALSKEMIRRRSLFKAATPQL